MSRPPGTASHAGGFSLIEMLVAVAILGLSLGLLYQASTGSLRSAGDIADAERAGWLAEALLASRDTVPAQGWSESGRQGAFEWAVQTRPLALPPDVKADTPVIHEVRVTVGWTGRLGPREHVVVTALPEALPMPGGSR